MIVENTLFGERNLPQLAIDRLRAFESAAIKKHPDGYWVGFSGGKDSIVLLDLVKKANVKHTVHFNVCSVDPPEVLRFIRQYYPHVIWNKPRITMFQLIVKHMMPPTRLIRYCCRELKERGGNDRIVVTGIRWEESAKRSKRRMLESCHRYAKKQYLNPILEWTDDEIWEYIHTNKLPYCCLYDEGFKRVGCIGCPMAGKYRYIEFARWPLFEKAYRHAFDLAAKKRLSLGNDYPDKYKWENGTDMWNWWLNDEKTNSKESDQGIMFE